jgi:formate hydrogenlyase transcriptional activator
MSTVDPVRQSTSTLRQYESLLEINNAVVSQLDLRELLKVISQSLRSVIPHDAALLTLHNPDNGQLRLHALDLQMFGKVPFEEGVLISMEDTPEGQAIVSGRPVLVGPDVDLTRFSSPWVRHAVDNGVRSGCAAPLFSHGRALGALSVVSLRENAFTEADAELLGRCANQIAIAVENALNYQRATQERDRFEMMLEASNAVSASLDLRELLRATSVILRNRINHDFAAMSLYDEDSGKFRICALDNPPEYLEEGHLLPMEGTPDGLAFKTRRAVWRERLDLTEFPAPTIQRAYEAGLRSGCAVPLISRGRVIGVLGVGSNRESSITQADAETLQLIANQIASAVENAINFERARQAEKEIRRQFERERLMLEINNAVVTQLSLRDVIRVTAALLHEVIGPDVTIVALYDADANQFRAYMTNLPKQMAPIEEGTPMPLKGTFGGMAFTSGRPIFLSRLDPQFELAEFDRQLVGAGISSGGIVPLIAHDRKLGVLGIGSFREAAFSEADQALLCHIANQIAIAVENALAYEEIEELKNKLTEEKLYLEDEIRTECNFDEIIGDSPALRRILREIETVAPTDSTILIRGETGTGKELIARAIHNLSRRREHTLVKINCAAIPTGLLESELFGHERGAFTGAISQRIGRFELAHHGTLFLDEVGDIPLELQPKLLRVLQEQEFERLGSTRTQKVDVRLVAATNSDLETMVGERKYRSDLYYRLNVFPVTVPPLRERPEDIPLLVRFFAQRFARRMKKPIESISARTSAALARYHWPGNVRELENVVERAVILSRGPELEIPIGEMKLPPEPLAPQPVAPVKKEKEPNASSLESVERDHILRVLEETRWVVAGPAGAAARLGMKRTTLQAKMRKLGISRRD